MEKGTAYQTDVGMCGDYKSVIGMNRDNSLKKFLKDPSAKKHYPALGEATISGLMVKADYKTGLYTSPHLVNVNERIRINGIPISNKEIDIFIRKYKTNIEKIGATFFETITELNVWINIPTNDKPVQGLKAKPILDNCDYSAPVITVGPNYCAIHITCGCSFSPPVTYHT